jgi:hypothetical protein
VAFFRRKRRVNVGEYKPAELIPPAPIDRVVEEGLLIATTAVRMHVKNHLIVDALRRDVNFDADALAEVASTEYKLIADQNEELAARQPEERYATIYSSLAEALRKAAADPERITQIVEEARDQAWNEVSGAVYAKLSDWAGDPVRDPDYEREKATRLRALIAIDLAGLQENARDVY